MAHLGVPRGIRAYRARTGAGARNLKPRAPVSVNRKPETYHNSEAETCNLQPTHPPCTYGTCWYWYLVPTDYGTYGTMVPWYCGTSLYGRYKR